jgi:hypothetical protein
MFYRTFLGKHLPSKTSVDLHPKQGMYVIYIERTIFQGFTKNIHHFSNRMERHF